MSSVCLLVNSSCLAWMVSSQVCHSLALCSRDQMVLWQTGQVKVLGSVRTSAAILRSGRGFWACMWEQVLFLGLSPWHLLPYSGKTTATTIATKAYRNKTSHVSPIHRIVVLEMWERGQLEEIGFCKNGQLCLDILNTVGQLTAWWASSVGNPILAWDSKTKSLTLPLGHFQVLLRSSLIPVTGMSLGYF